MDFSIAICTHNRCYVLKKTVERLINHLNRYASGEKFEIIIVDNNSNDKTKEIALGLQKKFKSFPIKYFFEKKQGISFARNKAVEKSRGEILVFIDDDIFISSNWLMMIKRALKRFPRAAIIGGKVLPFQALPKNKKWLLSVKGENDFLVLGLLNKGKKEKILHSDFALATANLIIRKQSIDSIGKFDESFGNNMGFFKIFSGEDIDFVQRALNKNFQVVYYPKLVVYHNLLPHKLTKSYFRWRYFENGKERANFDRIHKGKRVLTYNLLKLMINTPLDLRRTFSEYILDRPQNFCCEVSLFYTLGYLLASFVFYFKPKF